AIFKRSISGQWITFSEYPAAELETAIARFKESGFACTLPEEEMNAQLKEHIKRNFPQWMYSFRNPVFKAHATEAARMNNPPNAIPPQIWREMVRKWSDPSWVDTSDKNKENREKCELKSTCGSAPLAKYRLEEIKKTGREPDPIETFRKFHLTKDNFTTPKAQALHAGMEAKET
ncbi:unnamed protein product, partial [Linum tenue]